MPRRLRLESAEGVYHVINRGNYRMNLFRSEVTRAAFVHCLDETCVRTGWEVQAWCVMSNHYHLAVTTPQPNLVDGMRWLQGTFATRFNRRRDERGHLFQGRYKSLVVDPTEGLGPLCHYIHLNPVRAHVRAVEDLADYRWTSLQWMFYPRQRAGWFRPGPALLHAGRLADNPSGRKKYLEYLAWLAEDEPARQQQGFDAMSRGWIIGGSAFAKTVVQEHRGLAGHGPRLAAELQPAREAGWMEVLMELLGRIQRPATDLRIASKSADWKLALAAGLKMHTTVTNRWIARHLHMGNLHEVSRKVAAWSRGPDPKLLREISHPQAPNPDPFTASFYGPHRSRRFSSSRRSPLFPPPGPGQPLP